MKKNSCSVLLMILVVVAIFVMSIMFIYGNGYRWNRTPSFPMGIWRVERPFDPSRDLGELVLFEPPDTEVFRLARKRGYIPFGFGEGFMAPLIKRVVALEGDEVVINETGVYVNGKLLPKSRPFRTDRKGRALPLGKGKVLSENEVLLMSDYNERSFDGRYFGVVFVEGWLGIVERK
ncbi:MAG: conjugative transfer signal peptidase TraF [Candidatus Margulisbacteria bacterium]|nr:conjugative transfer signal peptidase TraF [Candidatus Margulisiibacteriota bacterium]